MFQNSYTTKTLPFAQLWLLLLLLMPLASQAQGAKSLGNVLEVSGSDSDLLFNVEVLSLSQRVYEISFRNIGTQVLLVPDGSFVFFNLFANRDDDGVISTVSMEVSSGIDHPAFNFSDTMEVIQLSPGESVTYTFEEAGAEEYVVTLRQQIIHIQIGYMVYNGEGSNRFVDIGYFLRSAREVTLLQLNKGPVNGFEPPSLGYHGRLDSWKRN